MGKTLSPTQLRASYRILKHISSEFLNTGLIYGGSGCGKRTIAQDIAESLGLPMVEIRLDSPSGSLETRLFGDDRDARSSQLSGIAPGELGSSEAKLLYLSGLENLPTELFTVISELFANGRYSDRMGSVWSVDSQSILLAGLTYPLTGVRVTPEHWLTTKVHWRVNVGAMKGGDIAIVAKEMVTAIDPDFRIADDALTILRDSPPSEGSLHSLRRWIESSVADTGSENIISSETIQSAIGADLRPVLATLRFRGESIPDWHLEKWLSQFPLSVRPTCVHIVRQIAARYYIGDQVFYSAANSLVSRAGIGKNEIVSFCKWEHIGKGSQRVAHVLKNCARWNLGEEIDLRHGISPSISSGSRTPTNILLVDDFVGSGKSLEKLFVKEPFRMAELLRLLPQAKVKILLIACFDEGIERIQNAISKAGLAASIEIIPHIVYSNSDRCSDESSVVIPDANKRREFIRCCLQLGEQNKIRSPLGFAGIAAATVFLDTVPNNSLAMFWHDAGSWYPLFPASRTISSYSPASQ